MKRPNSGIKNFGNRLAGLRKDRGLTQTQLGEMVGVTYRVIAYYEKETDYPPAHLIVPLAKALKVSTDALLGAKEVKQQLNSENATLWRRFKKMEQLPPKDRKHVFQLIDTLLEKETLKSK